MNSVIFDQKLCVCKIMCLTCQHKGECSNCIVIDLFGNIERMIEEQERKVVVYEPE